MKKILLSAMVLFAAMAVNAESEVGLSTATLTTTVDDTSVNTTVTDDAVLLYEGTYVDWYTGTNDTFKDGGASAKVTINGEEVQFAGAVGNANPSLASSPQSQGAPTAGGYFTFNVKTDGYLYILAKLNTEKNYVVHEDGTRIPYLWVGSCYSTDLPVLSFDLNDIEDALASDGSISDDYKIQTAKYYISDIANETSGVDCQAGVIKFPVKAGSTYTFCGTGTKCAVGGFYFDTTGDATITYTPDEITYTLLEEGVVPTASEEEGNGEDEGNDEEEGSGEVNGDTNASYECYFTDSSTATSSFYTFNGSSFNHSHGTATYNGTTYEYCFKMESESTITFTTTEELTLTIVFNDDASSAPNVYIDETDYTAEQVGDNWIIETTLEAGSHEISKHDSAYIFYINLTKEGTTGISSAIVSSNAENGAIYNLAGQRLSKLTKGINIVNGKKILVK